MKYVQYKKFRRNGRQIVVGLKGVHSGPGSVVGAVHQTEKKRIPKYSFKLSVHSSDVVLGHRYSIQTFASTTSGGSSGSYVTAKSSMSVDYDDYLDDDHLDDELPRDDNGETAGAREPLTATV